MRAERAEHERDQERADRLEQTKAMRQQQEEPKRAEASAKPAVKVVEKKDQQEKPLAV